MKIRNWEEYDTEVSEAVMNLQLGLSMDRL